MRWIALVLVVAIAAACGGGASGPSPTAAEAASTATPTPSPSPSPSPTPSPASSLWTLVEKRGDGFTIGLPPGWRQIDMDPQTIDASLNQTDDPEVRAILKSIQGRVRALVQQGTKLLAFDFTPGAASSLTNVNVQSVDLGRAVSLDSYVQAYIARLEQLDAVTKPVSHKRVRLATGNAEQVTFTSEGQEQTTLQYLLVDGQRLYVVTFITTADKATTYLSTFEKMAGTFALLR